MHLLYLLYAFFALIAALAIGIRLLKKTSGSWKVFLYLTLLAAPSVIFLPVSLNLMGMLYHHCETFLFAILDKPVSIGLAALILFLFLGIFFKEIKRLRWEKKMGSVMPYEAHLKVAVALEELLKTAKFAAFRNASVRVVPSERPFAFILGMVQPRIYVSAWLAENLTEEELKGVLAHELAHLSGKDHYLFPMARLFRQIGFYLPWIETIWNGLRLEREMRADRIAASCLESPVPIASALLKSWERRALLGEGDSLPLPAFIGEETAWVEKRLEGLMNGESAALPSGSGAFLIFFLILIISSPLILQVYLFSSLFC